MVHREITQVYRWALALLLAKYLFLKNELSTLTVSSEDDGSSTLNSIIVTTLLYL